MTDEVFKLFNYKGKDIIVRQKGKQYQVGIRGKNGIDIWFESTGYNSIDLVITSGREYARIVIDKMLLAEKEENYAKNT
jgi:NADPH-dependent curcumin reductase CurA